MPKDPARPAADPTPAQAFLAPIAGLARRQPAIEGAVFWGGPDGWPSEPTEVLEAEEIAYYAEGLLEEGFHLEWRILALPGTAADDHVRLFIHEGGAPPTPPAGADWQVLHRGAWDGVTRAPAG